MNLDIITQFIKWVFTPALFVAIALFVWRYLRARPNISLVIEGDGANQGSGNSGKLHFRWRRTFVLHNDSPYLARGVRLISAPLPLGWKFEGDLPTKLEPDERFKWNVVIDREEEVQSLTNLLGSHQRGAFGKSFLPFVLDSVSLVFSFKNRFGRPFYQVFRFITGQIESETSWRKPKH